MEEKEITLKLKKYGNYHITKKGVYFHLERRFRIFIPKRIIKRIEGMIVS